MDQIGAAEPAQVAALGDVIFTIRTYIRAAVGIGGFAVDGAGPGPGARQTAAEMRGYKNQLPIREALLAYLSRITG